MAWTAMRGGTVYVCVEKTRTPNEMRNGLNGWKGNVVVVTMGREGKVLVEEKDRDRGEIRELQGRGTNVPDGKAAGVGGCGPRPTGHRQAAPRSTR